MNSADVAKQICEELGIAWDETATNATLRGEPVDSATLFSSFYGNIVFGISVPDEAASNYLSKTYLVA